MDTLKSQVIRSQLGLTRADWARALGVAERTVVRWEDEGADPGGIACEVMRGIANALEAGEDPARMGRRVGMGIGSLVYMGLTTHPKAKAK